MQAGEGLDFCLNLTNVGQQAGEEVVQVYLTDLEASTVVPFHKLVAFKRVSLKAAECQELRFQISPEAMMLINDDGQAVLEPGKFRLTVGGCSPSRRGLDLGAPKPVTAEFKVNQITPLNNQE
jgi:beta-glucosidase